MRLSIISGLFTDRRESRGPCSDGTPRARHARKRQEKAIVSNLGSLGLEQMGASQGHQEMLSPPAFHLCLGLMDRNLHGGHN